MNPVVALVQAQKFCARDLQSVILIYVGAMQVNVVAVLIVLCVKIYARSWKRWPLPMTTISTHRKSIVELGNFNKHQRLPPAPPVNNTVLQCPFPFAQGACPIEVRCQSYPAHS